MLIVLGFPSMGAISLLGARKLYLSWGFGMGLVLLVLLVNAIVIKPMSAELGALNIYPEDVVFGGLALVAALRLSLEREMRARHAPWVLLGIASLISFAVGGALHGMRPAGVEYRNIFYVIASGLYCASFRFDSTALRKFVILWLSGAAALMALAWFRWAAGLAHLGIQSQWAGVGGDNALRVLNANQTLFLAQAFLVAIYVRHHITARWAWSLFSGSLLLTVILLQHRSVWVVLAASCAIIAWREQAWKRLAAIALIAVVVCLPVFLLVSNYAAVVADSFRTSAEEPFDENHSTISWRTQLWQEYLLEFVSLSGAQTWFGTGYGNPGIYVIAGYTVTNSAHNYYVFTLNRGGAVGLVLLLVSYTLLLRRLRGAHGSWDYLGLFLALTLGQLVFFMAYMPSYEQGLISGAALGMPMLGMAGRQWAG